MLNKLQLINCNCNKSNLQLICAQSLAISFHETIAFILCCIYIDTFDLYHLTVYDYLHFASTFSNNCTNKTVALDTFSSEDIETFIISKDVVLTIA